MELTKESLESMLTKNTEAISVYMEILRSKISTLDIYRRGIDEIVDNPDLREKYSPEDARSLRDLLIRLTRGGLKKKTLRRVEKKIREMMNIISSTEKAEVSLSDWLECYWSQYWQFLYDLKYLISIELFLYRMSSSAIARKLREFSEPAELAD